MKKFIQGIVITLIMAITIFTLGASLNAQNRFDSSLKPMAMKHKYGHDNDIKVVFQIYLNEQSIETTGVVIQLTNIKTKSVSSILINDNFSVYLLPDQMYAVKITHPGYNAKTILINTTAPNTFNWEIKASMYLYSGKPDEIAGVLYYDEKTDNFEIGPYKAK